MHCSPPSSEIQKARRSGQMKFQKSVRMSMMLVGLGAALLLARSARAQQDVDPTTFDINPGAVKVEQPVAQKAASIVAPAKVENESLVQTALWSSKATQQETDLARVTLVDALLVVILLAGTGLIVMYAKVATRRERRLQPILQDGHYAPASGATTH
jgi:recombinational DNA repair protein (RecF pathway)